MEDPKFYKEPLHYKRTWLAGKLGLQVKEYSCAEDNVDAPHIGPGPGPIGPDGTRLRQAGAIASATGQGSSGKDQHPRLGSFHLHVSRDLSRCPGHTRPLRRTCLASPAATSLPVAL